jgi:hypothetical protein
MDANYYPLVQFCEVPNGTFHSYPAGGTLPRMQTIYETRRQRLEILIRRHSSIADLNESLGWARTDPRVSRIRNANSRTDRDGKVYQMGDAMARSIEAALCLEEGWMDTPPTYAELNGQPDPASMAASMLAAMEPEAQYQALRLLGALAEPPKANGTSGQH